jgi:hypothetical protein
MSDFEGERANEATEPGFQLDLPARTAVRDLAQWIGHAAYASWFGGAVAIVVSFFGDSRIPAMWMWPGRLAIVLLNGWLGWWFMRIRDAFTNDGASEPDGHDSLMRGLAALQRYFAFHKVLAICGGVFLGMAFALAAFLLLIGR